MQKCTWVLIVFFFKNSKSFDSLSYLEPLDEKTPMQKLRAKWVSIPTEIGFEKGAWKRQKMRSDQWLDPRNYWNVT